MPQNSIPMFMDFPSDILLEIINLVCHTSTPQEFNLLVLQLPRDWQNLRPTCSKIESLATNIHMRQLALPLVNQETKILELHHRLPTLDAIHTRVTHLDLCNYLLNMYPGNPGPNSLMSTTLSIVKMLQDMTALKSVW